MKVSIGIIGGSNKAECEDHAFFNETAVNVGVYNYDCVELNCIGVADGVGGNAGGKEASNYISSQIIHTDFSKMSGNEIRQFITDINCSLIDFASGVPGKEQMATTLTCLVAASDGFYLIHAGNTRLYVVQGSYLKLITTDQTTYGWLMQRGQFEAADSCNRNELICCLGGGKAKYAEQLVVQKLFDNELPGTLILTSDGIHEYVDIDSMEKSLSSTDLDFQIIQQLIEMATTNGSIDDKTVIILKG